MPPATKKTRTARKIAPIRTEVNIRVDERPDEGTDAEYQRFVQVFENATPDKIPPYDIIKTRIPELRTQFGIQAAKPGERYGGRFPLTTEDKKAGRTRGKRVDFYHTSTLEHGQEGTELPVIYKTIGVDKREKVGDSWVPVLTTEGKLILTATVLHRFRHSIAKQLTNLRKTYWGADPALTIVTVHREASKSGFGNSETVVNTFTRGGLDMLGAEQKPLRDQGYLPADFPYPLKLVKLPPGVHHVGEMGGRPIPAKLPINRSLEAYGATLNFRRKRFLEWAARFGFGPASINLMTIDVLRAWTHIYFVVPGTCQELLKTFRAQKRPLSDVISFSWAAGEKEMPVMQARVRAAEAKLLEEMLPALPAPTQWNVTWIWRLPRIRRIRNGRSS